MSVDEQRQESTEQELVKLALLINNTVQELKYVVVLLKETRNNFISIQNNLNIIGNRITRLEVDLDHLNCDQHFEQIADIKDDIKELEKTKANRSDVNVMKWLVGAATLIGLVATIISLGS